MKLFTGCQEAERMIETTKRFTVSRLHAEEKNMPICHTHEFCEIYYSISGGKQFFIGENVYDTSPGDLFIVAPGEKHYLTEQTAKQYERYILFVAPAFLAQLSTSETDLSGIFLQHPAEFKHKLVLSQEQQNRLEFLLRKITNTCGFGGDLIENAAMVEILILLGGLYLEKEAVPLDMIADDGCCAGRPLAHKLIRYIDDQITEPLAISQIAGSFYISDSYACRIFKQEYGITINKYIQDRRLNIAKSLLMQGFSVTETCERSGFNDYPNFIKLFTRTIGISPKRYSVYTN